MCSSEVCSALGIDDGDAGCPGGDVGRALFGMAHGDDVRIAADGVDRVTHRLALGAGAGVGFGKAQHAAAQGQHGRLKAEPGAGGGLEKQGGQLLAVAGVTVLCRVCDDILRRGNELVNLLHREVGYIDKVSHGAIPLCLLF